jgi:nitroreductase/YHS domain-containing protein
MTAIDPVCGMEVEEAEAAATSTYRGRTIYFCALGCKSAFDLDPERYMSSPAQPPVEVPARDGTGVPEPLPAVGASTGAAASTIVVGTIRARRSVTRFRPDAVPQDAIERMLDAAVWVPNHHLTEPWEFFVLTGESRRRFAEIRREFRRTLLQDPDAPEFAKMLDKVYWDAIGTPAIIVVTTTNPDDPDLRNDDYAATMCAIQNMLLVATSLGLGTYLRTGGLIHFPPLGEFLGVPATRRIVGVVYVGYAAHTPARRRTEAGAKTHWLA